MIEKDEETDIYGVRLSAVYLLRVPCSPSPWWVLLAADEVLYAPLMALVTIRVLIFLLFLSHRPFP